MAESFVSRNTADTRELKAFARRLRLEGAPNVKRDTRRALRAAGGLVAERAKANAAEHSTKIPPTIKVAIRGATVIVQAGSNDVPIGSLFERGNRKSKPTAKTFRHPVFGSKTTFVYQPKHPYLRKAEEETGAEAVKLIRVAFREAIEQTAFGR